MIAKGGRAFSMVLSSEFRLWQYRDDNRWELTPDLKFLYLSLKGSFECIPNKRV